MENTVKERIKYFIDNHLRISVCEFEKSIESSNGYINSISRSIGVDKINNIVEKYPILNIDWLLTGRGEMTKNHQQIGNVTESTIVGANVNGSNNVFNHPEMIENASRNYQIIIQKQQEQIDRLLDLLEKKI
ncbi:hypothetical protein FACS1894195_0630 [Bacteroidia bacterium]|nr:hypothetical protein FACS1894195_0630 [Bacteroidia bacterium]